MNKLLFRKYQSGVPTLLSEKLTIPTISNNANTKHKHSVSSLKNNTDHPQKLSATIIRWDKTQRLLWPDWRQAIRTTDPFELR